MDAKKGRTRSVVVHRDQGVKPVKGNQTFAQHSLMYPSNPSLCFRRGHPRREHLGRRDISRDKLEDENTSLKMQVVISLCASVHAGPPAEPRATWRLTSARASLVLERIIVPLCLIQSQTQITPPIP